MNTWLLKLIEKIKEPMLKSLLSELVSIVDKAKEKGLSVRLIGSAAIYLHVLNCEECLELYEKLLTRGPTPPKLAVPEKAPAPAEAPTPPTAVKPEEVAEKVTVAPAKPETKVKEAPAPKIPEIEVLEEPKALEDEVLLSTLMLKSELAANIKVEVQGRNLLNYVGSRLVEQVRDLRDTHIYVSIRVPDAHIRLLFTKGKLTGVRIDLSDGAVLNGKEALSKLADTSDIVRTKAYVFRVPEDVVKQTTT